MDLVMLHFLHLSHIYIYFILFHEINPFVMCSAKKNTEQHSVPKTDFKKHYFLNGFIATNHEIMIKI